MASGLSSQNLSKDLADDLGGARHVPGGVIVGVNLNGNLQGGSD